MTSQLNQVPNLVIFWSLGVLTLFSGWCMFVALIGLKRGERDDDKPLTWEIKLVQWLGRFLLVAMGIAMFLVVSWGIMQLSLWVIS